MSRRKENRQRVLSSKKRPTRIKTRNFLFETLEARQLLAADFVYNANSANDPGFERTLARDGMNLVLRDPQGSVVTSQILSENTGRAVIARSNGGIEKLTIDHSVHPLAITFDGSAGTEAQPRCTL